MGGGTRLGVTGIVGGWGDEVRGHWSRLGNFTKRRLGNLTKRRYHDDQSISRFFILWLGVAPNFSVFFCADFLGGGKFHASSYIYREGQKVPGIFKISV